MSLLRHCAKGFKSSSTHFLGRCGYNTVPRITIPQPMVDKLYKKKVKLMARKSREIKQTGTVVIKCQKRELNHHKGQKYSRFGVNNLASAYWKNHRHNGEYFTINAIGKIPAFASKEDDYSTFEETGLREDICRALGQYEIEKPTNIQSLAIPQMLSGANVVCTSETGSGKTLAYLLPMVQSVLAQKELPNFVSKPNHPLGVIVVPSHELGDQICAVANDLAEHVNFKVVSICGRRVSKYLSQRRGEHMDILIASPGILSKALAMRILEMRRLSMLVLDEADTLLDDSFSYVITKILNRTTDHISKYEGLQTKEKDIPESVNELEDSEPTDSDYISQEEMNQVGNEFESDKLFTYSNINSHIKSERNLVTENIKTHKDDYGESTKKWSDSAEEFSANYLYEENESVYEGDHFNEFSSELDGGDSGYDGEIPMPKNINESTNDQSDLPLYGHNLEHFKHKLKVSLKDLALDVPAEKVHVQDSPVQFCMIGATIPTTIQEVFGSLVPINTIKTVRSSHIHRVLPHVAQKFIRVTADDKIELTLTTLKKNMQKQIPTIVFCNNIGTVKFLMHTFEECGLRPISVLFSDKLGKQERRGVFSAWESGKTDVLLCTDLGSRGLDTTRARVVINYDFPREMSDYIHRAGRVGRVGSDGTGVVINYIHQKWDVELLWKIEMATRKEAQLEGVDGNIKGLHNERHRLKREQKMKNKVVELHV